VAASVADSVGVGVGVGVAASVGSADAVVASEDTTMSVERAELLTALNAIMPPAPPAVSAAVMAPSAFALARAVGVR
jgi:hypothetical protein